MKPDVTVRLVWRTENAEPKKAEPKVVSVSHGAVVRALKESNGYRIGNNFMNCKSWFFAKQHLLAAALGLLLFLFSGRSEAQITPLGDAYINSSSPGENYGTAGVLSVDGTATTSYIQFNLASIPAGATLSLATLKLYVNSVNNPGSFNVEYISGSWSESTIDYSNAPALGNTIASDVAITNADKNQYILINVTSAVEAWLSGSETNNGIALVANSTFHATFDSKENTNTSHPAELDIAWAGGDGTITGVTTAAGSGLTGGGTSGTLSLGLTTVCSSGQVLSWSGSAWACTSLSGGGTITGVTAGTDLTGGGTSGTVTLNLNTAKVPLLASANTFTANQTVDGNLSATGVVTGSSFQIGSNLFDYGSYANQNAFLGFAGNTVMTGTGNTASGPYALYSNTTGEADTGDGLYALVSNTSGSYNTGVGSEALLANTTGSYNSAFGYAALYYNSTATDNNAFGFGALFNNTTGSPNDAFGYQALYDNSTGVANAAFGFQALYGNTTGGQNVASGFDALVQNTTGYQNTAIGFASCLDNTTGSGLTCVGALAATAVDGLTNATAIGAHAVVGQSNSLVLGGTGDHAVKVGIGTTQPSNVLTIARGAGPPVSDSWETYSSRRWKTNIHPLQNALGKVEQLRGVSYDLKDSGKHEIGVIAEEVGAVVPEVVSYEQNGKDAAGVDYGRLTALLIEAVKQQQQEISKLRKQLRTRVAKEAALESRLEQLEQQRGEAQLASSRPGK